MEDFLHWVTSIRLTSRLTNKFYLRGTVLPVSKGNINWWFCGSHEYHDYQGSGQDEAHRWYRQTRERVESSNPHEKSSVWQIWQWRGPTGLSSWHWHNKTWLRLAEILSGMWENPPWRRCPQTQNMERQKQYGETIGRIAYRTTKWLSDNIELTLSYGQTKWTLNQLTTRTANYQYHI